MKKLNNEIPHNHNRRKLMVGTLAGASAAAVWHKPMLKSVLLPAHAQTSTIVTDFFATNASVTVVSNQNPFLDLLVPSAYARQNPGPNPANLLFEAEAIAQSNGSYAVKIAAGDNPNISASQNSNIISGPVNQITYEYGWLANMAGVSAAASLSPTGCAQTETATITAISPGSMIIEMSFFNQTVILNLNAGNASLPVFPLSCS